MYILPRQRDQVHRPDHQPDLIWRTGWEAGAEARQVKYNVCGDLTTISQTITSENNLE